MNKPQGTIVGNGKYTIVRDDGCGLRVYKYGHQRLELSGNYLILDLIQEIEALQKYSFSFNALRNANIIRIADVCFKKCEDEWTTAHWMQATVGELGELANIMKKIDRGDFTIDEVRSDIAEELADVQIYLDIMAHKLGVDLGKATIQKFNKVSKKIGSQVTLQEGFRQ